MSSFHIVENTVIQLAKVKNIAKAHSMRAFGQLSRFRLVFFAATVSLPLPAIVFAQRPAANA